MRAYFRLAAALAASIPVVAFTTTAVSQNGGGLVLRQPQVVALAAPPTVTIVEPAGPPPSLATLVADKSEDVADIDPQTRCLARMVQIEARGQPLKGQLAVAEVVINRVRSRRFPDTPCAVINQPGQFFHAADFKVHPGSRLWRTAVAIARIAQTEEAPRAAPGALFFHASYVRPDWSGHVRLAQIADQVFYR